MKNTSLELKKCNVQLFFLVKNKFNKILFHSTKDKKSNDVYRHTCKTCKKTYVGCTSRPLYVRNKEHEKSIDKLFQNTALAKNAGNYSHTFDFDINNVTLLECKSNLDKRLHLEMIHNNTINFKTDN